MFSIKFKNKNCSNYKEMTVQQVKDEIKLQNEKNAK
jgi:hypothetical protein